MKLRDIENGRSWRWQLAALAAFASALIAAIGTHQDWIAGSWYWRWSWRDMASLAPIRWYGGLTLAAAPIMGAIAIERFAIRSRATRAAMLALLALGSIAIKLVSLAILTQPMSFSAMNAIVRSPTSTSYYTDAAALAGEDDWLVIYPQILPQTNLHTQSKPPGAVAYYRTLIRRLGYGDRSASTGGTLLAVIAALSIPATFCLVQLLTRDDRVASCAAILMSLCPGFELIFPTFDATYPLLTFALIGTWHLAATRDDWRFAIAFGATLALTCFITYNLLVLGAFLVAWAIAFARPFAMARAAIIALLTVVGLYAAASVFTGFDPISTFASAWRNQQNLLAQHRGDRPYPWTIFFDLLDFALGAGWLIVPLAVIGATRAMSRSIRITMSLCLAQPLLVAVIGLLQSETARAWNFMLPLLILPAALALSRWPARARAAAYFLMLAVLLVVGRHMVFM